MSASNILQHQLSGYSESVANDITRLSKFAFFPRDFHKNEDARQAAIELVLRGHPAATAIRHARAQVARDFRPVGFTSLDSEAENEVLIHERIASSAPDEIEHWRTVSLDDATESMLSMLADSAGALAGFCGATRKRSVTKRRAQQIVKQLIEKAAQGDLFNPKRGEDDNDEAEVSTTNTPHKPKPSPDAVELEEEVEHG